MAARPDFFKLLPEPREQAVNRLEAYARDPSRTIDQVHVWLMSEFGFVDSKEMPAHPMALSRSAVGRWKQGFDLDDRMSAAAEVADAIYTANAAAGAVDLMGANNLLLAQQIQTKLAGSKKLKTKDIRMLSSSQNLISSAEARVDKLKRVAAAALDKLNEARTTKRGITQDDINEARRAIFGT